MDLRGKTENVRLQIAQELPEFVQVMEAESASGAGFSDPQQQFESAQTHQEESAIEGGFFSGQLIEAQAVPTRTYLSSPCFIAMIAA